MSVAVATSAADAAVIFDTITGVTANSTPVRIAAPGNPQRQIQDQTGSSQPGNAVIVAGGPLATSFVVTNTTTITSVVLSMTVSFTGGNGGAVVFIVPNNGSNSPVYSGTGQSLAFGAGTVQIGTILDSAIGTSATLATVTTSQILTPGTYWLAVEADMDLSTPGIQQGTMNYTSPSANTGPNITNSMRWNTATSFAPLGANLSGQSSGQDFAQFISPGVYTTSTSVVGGGTIGGVFMAQINGTINSSEQETPEPATLAVLGAGLVGMGLVRRMRNRKTQA